jgi:hypothetical protein
MKKQSTDSRNAVLPGDPTIDYPFALPYGLRPEQGVLVPDKQTAPVVTEIFERARKGEEPGTIAQALNDQKIAPPERAKEWTPEAIEAILRNPAYMGDWGGFGRVEEALVGPELFESAQSSATA